MSILLIGLFLFLGIHCISILNDPWRNRMVNKIGKWGWKGIYGLVSIFGFILIIRGYEIARLDAALLYTPPSWLQYFAFLLLLPAFPLLVAAYFPGRIKAATKHPMLLSTVLWSVAHLLSTGSLVNVILFGSFLVWAIIDIDSIEHRTPRAIPEAPFSRFNDIIACIVGLGLFLTFVFWLHEYLFGVALF